MGLKEFFRFSKQKLKIMGIIIVALIILAMLGLDCSFQAGDCAIFYIPLAIIGFPLLLLAFIEFLPLELIALGTILIAIIQLFYLYFLVCLIAYIVNKKSQSKEEKKSE
jgi:hypothetical protein